MDYTRKDICTLANMSISTFKTLERRGQLPWEDPANPNAELMDKSNGWSRYNAEQVMMLACCATLSADMPVTTASDLAGYIPLRTCVRASMEGGLPYFSAHVRIAGEGRLDGLTGGFFAIRDALKDRLLLIENIILCNVGRVTLDVMARSAVSGIAFDPQEV